MRRKSSPPAPTDSDLSPREQKVRTKRTEAEERRRSRQTRGAVYDLTERERRFVLAIVGGCSDSDAALAIGYRADRAERGARVQMRKPIVRAAIFQLRSAPVPDGVDPSTHEIRRLALIPEDLLANKPTWADKRWAMETLEKLGGRFPGSNSKNQGVTLSINVLLEAAKRRQPITIDQQKTEKIAVEVEPEVETEAEE